ncbi:MAG: hypothetical protein K0U72_08515 [Gammaproteobacteria bacterium]|nr:hypothetical protein [Gammaproteobacteria bacterium]
MRVAAGVLAIVFFLSASVAANDATPPAFKVAIEVTVSDQELRDRVSMYLRNELRSLGDVEVTSDNPDYKLYTMVTEVRSKTGGRIAYVLGTSIVSFFPDGYFDSVLSARLRNADEVARRLEEVTVYRNQFLSVSGPSEAHLIETVTNSVAKLNAHVLEPERTNAP